MDKKPALVLRTHSQLPKISPQSQNPQASLGLFRTLPVKTIIDTIIKRQPILSVLFERTSLSSIPISVTTKHLQNVYSGSAGRVTVSPYGRDHYHTSATEKKERKYTCFQLKQNWSPHLMESEMQ